MNKLRYRLIDLVDIDELGRRIEELYSLTSIPLAIVDIEGRVLKEIGWRELCRDFRGEQLLSSKLYRECDGHCLDDAAENHFSAVYVCPNGMIESDCPIVINGHHLANVFAGQVLREPVSGKLLSRFRHQVHNNGFDELEYFQALKGLSLFFPSSYTGVRAFLSVFTRKIASQGLSRLKELEQIEIIRKNEEQLRLTIEAINDGLWDWEVEEDIITWSSRSYSMLGYELEAFAVNFHVWQDLIHPQDRTPIHEELLHRISCDEPFLIRFRHLTLSGNYIWVVARGKVVARTPDGSVKRVLGTFTDSTNLVQAEEKFEKAFQKNPILMAISDIETGEFLAVNDKFIQTVGYSREELIGKRSTALGILTRESRNYLNHASQKNKLISNHAVSIRNRKGEELQCLYFTEIIKSNGRDRLLSIIQDITEQKKYEKERRLLEEQLQQAVKLEALGTLAGGIAHDFNNILTAIFGYSQIALDQLPPSSPVAEDIEQVLHAANRAADLVQQILLYSRQEKEDIFQPLRLQDTIEEVAHLLYSSFPSTIHLSLSIDQDCGVVMGDPTQIHQVVMNLCTNGMQAIENDYGTLVITLTEVNAPASLGFLNGGERGKQRVACIEVSDSGSGIAEEIKAKIFDPFFTTKGKAKGTGLGLAVVNGIVQNHHGRIVLESEPGAGATFRVYLPIVDEQILAKSSETGLSQGGCERILLVDDEETLIYMHRRELEKYGYQVTCYSDSLKAFEDFRQRRDCYDVVVTDMTMPNLTGLDLIKEILKINPETQSILCTGYSNSVNRVKAKSLGVNEYLMKPFPPRVLAETIRMVLDHG